MDIIPYFFMKNCPNCSHRKRVRSGIILIVYIVLAFWIRFYPVRLDYWLSLFVLIFFGVITVIDIEYRVILNETMFIGAGFFLLIGLSYHSFWQTVIGGVAGFFIMLGFYYLGILVQKLRYRNTSITVEEEALGFGDVNLLGVLGLLLGWPAVIAGLFIGVITAGVFSLFVIMRSLILRDYRSNMSIPYGPFLVLGAFLLLFVLPK